MTITDFPPIDAEVSADSRQVALMPVEPPQTLLQDASRGLFDALSSKPDAKMHAREAAAAIAAAQPADQAPAPITDEARLGPLPPADTRRALQYDAIRYVAGYPESYVHEYARAYAAEQVTAERAERDKLRAALVSIHWRVARSGTAFDDIAAAVLAEVCEQAIPELRALRPGAGAEGQ